MPSLDQIVHWLIIYKYIVIFPIAVVEGPIITIISGFLASIHVLSFGGAFTVVALGDLVGDSLYYCLGRFGRKKFISKFGKFFGLDEYRVERMEKHFKTHPWKTFIFGKVAHGTGSIILIAAGMSRVPYFEFLGYNIPTTFANSLTLVVIGYYFGHAYKSINKYFDYTSIFFLILLVALYVYFIRRAKKSALNS
jgi:membrane-associated protein